MEPAEDDRLTMGEATQHLAAAPERSESEAAELLHTLGGHGDQTRPSPPTCCTRRLTTRG